MRKPLNPRSTPTNILQPLNLSINFLNLIIFLNSQTLGYLQISTKTLALFL